MVYTAKYTDANSVYKKSGLSATECDVTANDSQLIAEAEGELELICGRKFSDANSITEYLSTKDKDILGNAQTSIQLNHFPVQSVTGFELLDASGNSIVSFSALTSVQIAAGTFQTSDYWVGVSNDPLTNTVVPNGKITLKAYTIPKGTNNVKVAYTYGYATVPTPVKNLASCLTGIRAWVNFLGGSYNRLNSYSIPQQTVDKGDFYARGTKMIELLEKEALDLLDRIGRKPRTMILATGSDR